MASSIRVEYGAAKHGGRPALALVRHQGAQLVPVDSAAPVGIKPGGSAETAFTFMADDCDFLPANLKRRGGGARSLRAGDAGRSTSVPGGVSRHSSRTAAARADEDEDEVINLVEGSYHQDVDMGTAPTIGKTQEKERQGRRAVGGDVPQAGAAEPLLMARRRLSFGPSDIPAQAGGREGRKRQRSISEEYAPQPSVSIPLPSLYVAEANVSKRRRKASKQINLVATEPSVELECSQHTARGGAEGAFPIRPPPQTYLGQGGQAHHGPNLKPVSAINVGAGLGPTHIRRPSINDDDDIDDEDEIDAFEEAQERERASAGGDVSEFVTRTHAPFRTPLPLAAVSRPVPEHAKAGIDGIIRTVHRDARPYAATHAAGMLHNFMAREVVVDQGYLNKEHPQPGRNMRGVDVRGRVDVLDVCCIARDAAVCWLFELFQSIDASKRKELSRASKRDAVGLAKEANTYDKDLYFEQPTCGLRPETLLCAVSLLDRYLSSRFEAGGLEKLVELLVDGNFSVTLLCCTALWMSSKMHESWSTEVVLSGDVLPRLECLRPLTYEKEQRVRDALVVMEETMWKGVNFRILVPTADNFLSVMCSAAGWNAHSHPAWLDCYYLVEMALCSHEFVRVKPSLMAAAAFKTVVDVYGDSSMSLSPLMIPLASDSSSSSSSSSKGIPMKTSSALHGHGYPDEELQPWVSRLRAMWCADAELRHLAAVARAAAIALSHAHDAGPGMNWKDVLENPHPGPCPYPKEDFELQLRKTHERMAFPKLMSPSAAALHRMYRGQEALRRARYEEAHGVEADLSHSVSYSDDFFGQEGTNTTGLPASFSRSTFRLLHPNRVLALSALWTCVDSDVPMAGGASGVVAGGAEGRVCMAARLISTLKEHGVSTWPKAGMAYQQAFGAVSALLLTCNIPEKWKFEVWLALIGPTFIIYKPEGDS